MDMTISPAIPKAPAPDGDTRSAEVARDFEAMMLGRMVDGMMATVETGRFGGGHAEDTWRSFLSDAIGEAIARQGGTGIAGQIESAIARYDRASRA